MSIRLIFIFSSCIKLMSSDATEKKRNVQNQLLFFVIDYMITLEKIQKLLYCFLLGGEGGINCQSSQTSC